MDKNKAIIIYYLMSDIDDILYVVKIYLNDVNIIDDDKINYIIDYVILNYKNQTDNVINLINEAIVHYDESIQFGNNNPLDNILYGISCMLDENDDHDDSNENNSEHNHENNPENTIDNNIDDTDNVVNIVNNVINNAVDNNDDDTNEDDDDTNNENEIEDENYNENVNSIRVNITAFR